MQSPRYGFGKTEIISILRGRGKAHAIAQLQQWTMGQGLEACPHIPLGNNKAIRVVNGYKHLGAMANAAVKFNAEIAARTAAASGIEATLKRAVCSQTKFKHSVRVNIAAGIHSALLYAAATWPNLTLPQLKIFPSSIAALSAEQ